MVLSDYEKQPWYIRWYRWWRYMPPRIILACYRLIKWSVTGMQPEIFMTRWETIILIYQGTTARAQLDMGACISSDELREDIDGS